MTHELQFATWNVQGLRNEKKRKAIIRLLQKEKLNVIALQECYLDTQAINIVSKEWKGEIHFSESQGRSKGLITLFDIKTEGVKITKKETNERFIISEIEIGEEHFLVINVYAPCEDREKRQFLIELTRAIQRYNVTPSHLVCMGDFNMVVSNDQDIVSGNSHNRVTIEQFNEWITELNLYDTWREKHPNVLQYTWCRKHIARRLDYIFVGDIINNRIKESSILNLGFSDHKLVKCKCMLKPRPRHDTTYKLNTNLLNDEKYTLMMKEFIQKFKENTTNELNPHMKWELLKAEIKSASRQYGIYKQTNKKNESLLKRQELEKIDEECILNPSDTSLQNRKCKLQTELEILELEKARGAQIRAKIKWIEQGEKGTKFFLNLERKRQQQNSIISLVNENGENLTNENDIMHEIKKYYETLYTENDQHDIFTEHSLLFITNLEIPQITEQDRTYCEEEITEKELHAAILSSRTGSSPGGDGIPIEFYKHFWGEIKDILLEVMRYSEQVGVLSPTQRQGTFCLLHKGKDLPKECLSNWRPISLTNADYKIFSKILALRINKMSS